MVAYNNAIEQLDQIINDLTIHLDSKVPVGKQFFDIVKKKSQNYAKKHPNTPKNKKPKKRSKISPIKNNKHHKSPNKGINKKRKLINGSSKIVKDKDLVLVK